MNEVKILIVEDNVLVALELRNTIIELGYSVSDIVSNEIDVLNSITNNEPDIIIMDINLQDKIDGIDIVQSIYKKKYIPVIYSTAYSDELTMDRAIQTNPVGYLIKPYNVDDIQAVIKLALFKIGQPHQVNQLFQLNSNYSFDLENQYLYYQDSLVKLSINERKILNLLIEAEGKVVLFETIENIIWDNQPITNDAIRNLISRLRKKLPSNLIETVYSHGFRLKI